MNGYKRIVVYLSEEEHRRLKSKLALAGKTVSEWFRENVKVYLKKQEDTSE